MDLSFEAIPDLQKTFETVLMIKISSRGSYKSIKNKKQKNKCNSKEETCRIMDVRWIDKS